MIIRIAIEADIPALVEHINRGYRGESSRAGWTTEADLLEGTRVNENELRAILADEKADLHIFGETATDIQASVYLKKESDHLYLGMLTVRPVLQGSGFGKKVLRYAEDFAKVQGFQCVKMTVIEARAELIAWYNRNGYLPSGYSFPWDDAIHIGIRKQAIHFIELEKKLLEEIAFVHN